jgi:hypothetical protein
VSPSRAQRRATAERRVRCLRLRAAGVGFGQIAAELGYASEQAASVDARRALAGAREEITCGDAPGLELARMDALERTGQQIMTQALAARDYDLALQAVDRLVRVSAQRRSLLGIAAADSARTPATSRRDELAERRAARRGAAAAG